MATDSFLWVLLNPWWHLLLPFVEPFISCRRRLRAANTNAAFIALTKSPERNNVNRLPTTQCSSLNAATSCCGSLRHSLATISSGLYSKNVVCFCLLHLLSSNYGVTCHQLAPRVAACTYIQPIVLTCSNIVYDNVFQMEFVIVIIALALVIVNRMACASIRQCIYY